MKNTFRKNQRPNDRMSQPNLPTIGFFIANTVRTWELLQWWGVADAAREQNVNLICFPGRELRSPQGFDAQANILYDLVTSTCVDGIVLWTGGFERFVERSEVETFCARYTSLPIVSAETAVKGIPSITLDNYQAMRDLLVHLIEGHGYRRIGYITSRQTYHIGFRERYRAYEETMAAYGLPVDPTLIYLGVDDTAEMAEWFRANARANLEAIVGFNDDGVLHAMHALQSIGRRVPEDVAVAGFDNIAESRASTPPLTTVWPPFYDMGRKSVELLLAMIQGDHVPEKTILSSTLVIRQSCGCTDPIIVQAGDEPEAKTDETFETAFAICRDPIRQEIIRTTSSSTTLTAHIEHLLDVFKADVQDPSSGMFLSALNAVLCQAAADGADVEVWQNAISVLRRQVLPALVGKQRDHAEALWQQARIMIGQTAWRQPESERLKAAHQALTLSEIGEKLLITFDVTELMTVLVEGLLHLGIPCGYLALYEDPAPYHYPQKASEWSRLILAYRERRRIDLDPRGQRFQSHHLIPAEFFFRETRSTFIAESLYFRDKQIGVALFEMGPREGDVYDALRREISSALQGASLVQQVQEHAMELSVAYEEIRSLNEQLREENLRMIAELDVAHRIQAMVLPPPEELRQIEGLDIVGFMKPADEVGGDYYDVLAEDGIIHIGIGDVTGHGLESGVLMLMTQTAIRTLIDHGEQNPIAILTTLNRTIYNNLQRMRVDKTLTLAFVNYQGGHLTFVGQHEEMIVVRRDGQIELVDTVNLGFPIGLEQEIATFIQKATVFLQPGDGIVLYTDGITEAENLNGEMYGLTQLCEIISRNWNNSAGEIKQAVVDDVTRFIGTQKVYDDLTLVVMKQK